MTEIYKPAKIIAVASSFEGILNDGAPECALVSFNAYQDQVPGSFFGGKMSAAEFNNDYRNTVAVKAFLALRPLVEVAEDYRTVLDLMNQNVSETAAFADNPNDPVLYAILVDKFNAIKQATKAERDAFGKGKESLFYKAREALKGEDYKAWLNTQVPFSDTIPEFRKLVETQQWDGNVPKSGFFPRFATSKDEKSTIELCTFYTDPVVGKLDKSDVGDGRCLIPPNGIVGMETVPSRNKVEQLKVIAEKLGVPRGQVWRMNDRYDPKQQEELYAAGFVYQFFLPGYATPTEIEKSKSDKFVRLLDRKNFAEQLANFAKDWGF